MTTILYSLPLRCLSWSVCDVPSQHTVDTQRDHEDAWHRCMARRSFVHTRRIYWLSQAWASVQSVLKQELHWWQKNRLPWRQIWLPKSCSCNCNVNNFYYLFDKINFLLLLLLLLLLLHRDELNETSGIVMDKSQPLPVPAKKRHLWQWVPDAGGAHVLSGSLWHVSTRQ